MLQAMTRRRNSPSPRASTPTISPAAQINPAAGIQGGEHQQQHQSAGQANAPHHQQKQPPQQKTLFLNRPGEYQSQGPDGLFIVAGRILIGHIHTS